MDYNKDNIAKDKAQTWKTFNKLTIYTIIFVAIILIIIFSLFSEVLMWITLIRKISHF